MIRRLAKSSFALVKHQPNQIQKANVKYEHRPLQASRVQLLAFSEYWLPGLVKALDALPMFQRITQYNPAFTNGGTNFEQFPLVKMLHIGLRMLEQKQSDGQVWKQFEKTIRTRMHRCTVEEHMRLLLIMLRIWPVYKFRTEFITSICLALKKQLTIMNDDELKLLLRVTAADFGLQDRFQGKVLVQLQNFVLNKAINRWQLMSQKKQRCYSLQGLYLWIQLGAALLIRNNPHQLIMEGRVTKLAQMFTQLYHLSVVSNTMLRRPVEQDLIIMLQLFNVFEPINKFYLAKNSGQKRDVASWGEQFIKLKASILGHGSSRIQTILGKINEKGGARTLKWILTLIDSKTVENLLESNQQSSLAGKSNTNQLYPRIKKLVESVMAEKDDNQTNTKQKLYLLNQLILRSIMDWQVIRLYYQSLQLQNIITSSLPLVYSLLQIQLHLYTLSNLFKPNSQAHRLIISCLSERQTSARNLDWLAFHYFRLSVNPSQRKILQTNQLENINNVFSSRNNTIQWNLLNRVLLDAKNCSKDKLIQQEQLILKSKTDLLALKKFFIQVRLHEMQCLQAIIPPFYRLPHFANSHQKLVINAYPHAQLKSPAVKLQKRLLNDLGWKVVNVQIPYFSALTLGERIRQVGTLVQNEQHLLGKIEQELLQLGQ